KDVQIGELIAAMRVVGRGGKTLDPASSAAVIEQIRRGKIVTEEDRLAAQLTERELKILDLIAEGLTNREIGEQLYLSEKTVKHHVSDILSKLGMSRRDSRSGGRRVSRSSSGGVGRLIQYRPPSFAWSHE
ncbi:MAG: hypothetical protein C4321_10940, partial [Chloroflexota bacterium]